MKEYNSNNLSMREFYKGKKILVTGFTGTLGKLLVEKLLYSCPEIEKIYVLVRTKKGIHPQQRIKQITSSRAFVRFKEDLSIIESKLVAIAGDIGEENLGLSPEDENLLRKEINIIFHCAATVRFDEPLHVAHNINTAGTKRVVDLALNMQNLICFTHISTAFSNCDKFYIKEELYPPPADWRKTHQMCDKIDPAILQTLHMKCINKLPNTYTFTKALSEHVINDHRDKLPVLIVRPSIVIFSCKEPEPYYIDHLFTAPGLTIFAMLGLFSVALIREDSWFNEIPSDIAVNSILAATCKYVVGENQEKKQENVEVYNLCSPAENNHTFSTWFNQTSDNKEFTEKLNRDGLPYQIPVLCENMTYYKINYFFRHMISAYIIDLLLSIKGINPMVARLRRKVLMAWIMLKYFTLNTFYFETTKIDRLIDDLKPEERESFGWNFGTMDTFIPDFNNIYEIEKRSIMKPYFDDIKTNSKRLKMLRMMDMFGVILTYSTIALLIYYTRLHFLLFSSVIKIFTLS